MKVLRSDTLIVEVDFLWNRSVDSLNLQFCSRENQLLQLLQQNEKSTQKSDTLTLFIQDTSLDRGFIFLE